MMQVTRAVKLLACSVAALALSDCGASHQRVPGSQPPLATVTALDRASNGIQALQSWYSQSSGLYQSTGWWNSANAITVLVNYERAAKTHQYDPALANTFSAAQAGNGHPGFINQYYDDEGWWALAWIDAYDFTGRPEYLQMAESIFADMTSGWDSVCNGGSWWSKARSYKNAIANELFLSVAAHLANRDAGNRAQYLDWANREWAWFAASGMINGNNLINDGLTINSSTGACANNGATTWSYNQGVVLGGLAELSKLEPDPTLAQTAEKIATAATTTLADSNGILHDHCEPNCGADGVQFKGIFVRNLLDWYNISSNRAAYATFITNNANAIWASDQGANFDFGQVWSGPYSGSNAGTQSSALDALVSAAALAGH